MVESKQERVEKMRTAVSTSKNPTGTLMAKAYLEDEAVREASQERSELYLLEKEEDVSGLPVWGWCLLWFAIGMTFGTIAPNVVSDLWHFFSMM